MASQNLTPCFIAADGTVCTFIMKLRQEPSRYRLNQRHLLLFDRHGQPLSVPLTLPEAAHAALKDNPRLRVATCDAEGPLGFFECEQWLR